MTEQPSKLIRVSGPFVRANLRMKPCQPTDGPITQGPLTVISNPVQRANLKMIPAEQRALQLTCAVDTGTTLDSILSKLAPILELVKGCGFEWDRAGSSGEPGKIVIRFMPQTADAIERMEWLKETLTPILVTTMNIPDVVVTELPALKV